MPLRLSATGGLAAAALLASKFGEGFAEDAGGSAWGVVKKLWGLVGGKLAGDKGGEYALELLEAEPAELGHVNAIAERLTQLMAMDSGFAADLTGLVEEAQKDPANKAVFGYATGQARQVNIGGDNFGAIAL